MPKSKTRPKAKSASKPAAKPTKGASAKPEQNGSIARTFSVRIHSDGVRMLATVKRPCGHNPTPVELRGKTDVTFPFTWYLVNGSLSEDCAECDQVKNLLAKAAPTKK